MEILEEIKVTNGIARKGSIVTVSGPLAGIHEGQSGKVYGIIGPGRDSVVSVQLPGGGRLGFMPGELSIYGG